MTLVTISITDLLTFIVSITKILPICIIFSKFGSRIVLAIFIDRASRENSIC